MAVSPAPSEGPAPRARTLGRGGSRSRTSGTPACCRTTVSVGRRTSRSVPRRQLRNQPAAGRAGRNRAAGASGRSHPFPAQPGDRNPAPCTGGDEPRAAHDDRLQTPSAEDDHQGLSDMSSPVSGRANGPTGATVRTAAGTKPRTIRDSLTSHSSPRPGPQSRRGTRHPSSGRRPSSPGGSDLRAVPGSELPPPPAEPVIQAVSGIRGWRSRSGRRRPIRNAGCRRLGCRRRP